MRYIIAMILASVATMPVVKSQSNLLEGVKRNPQEALALCNKFRSLNSEGISASSKQAITEISKLKNLTAIDAEILSIYVIGLHCPDVK